MKSDFMFMKKSPVTGRKSQEMTKIMADAIGYRDDDGIMIRKMIGAEVVGMTVCPCAIGNLSRKPQAEAHGVP